MQGCASSGREPLVRYLLGERMREHVGRVDVTAALGKKFESCELAQERIECSSLLPDGAQERHRDLASEDGRGLQESLELLGEPLDPREENLLYRVGHR